MYFSRTNLLTCSRKFFREFAHNRITLTHTAAIFYSSKSGTGLIKTFSTSTGLSDGEDKAVQVDDKIDDSHKLPRRISLLDPPISKNQLKEICMLLFSDKKAGPLSDPDSDTEPDSDTDQDCGGERFIFQTKPGDYKAVEDVVLASGHKGISAERRAEVLKNLQCRFEEERPKIPKKMKMRVEAVLDREGDVICSSLNFI